MRHHVLLALVLSLGIGCTHIEPGEVGVRVESCSGGGVQKEPLGVGYHFSGFCSSIQEFATTQYTLNLSGEDTLHPTDSQGMVMTTDLAFSFSVDPARAPQIWTKWKRPVDDIAHTYIKKTVQDSAQEVFSRYTAQELYSFKKTEARLAVEKLLHEKLSNDGFLAGPVNLVRLEPPKEVVDAINAKVAMAQQAEQAQAAVARARAQGEQAVATAEAEAKATLARAQATASATKIQAEAEAIANRKLAESITPVLVDYKLAGRWNGVMPTYQGGGTPLVKLKTPGVGDGK